MRIGIVEVEAIASTGSSADGLCASMKTIHKYELRVSHKLSALIDNDLRCAVLYKDGVVEID
jgi:hypothetical protein